MGVFTFTFLTFGGTQQVSIAQSWPSLGRVGSFQVCTRSDVLSSRAGLLLLRDLVEQLGVGPLLQENLRVKVRRRGYDEGAAVLGLIYNLASGGECLSDLNVLRGDPATQQLLGVDSILAPTTAGEFLRKFDIGDIRDLARANRLVQARAHQLLEAAAAAARRRVCTLDVDSSIYEQCSTRKQGSCKAYNGEIGYHPLLAFWAETQELLMSHLRRGSAHTARNAVWFLKETKRAVPEECELKLRADSGFYDKAVVGWCEANAVIFAITADQTKPLLALIEALAENAWQDLERYGLAQVAQVRYQPMRWQREYRYVVKRELVQNKKGELEFRYHVLVTNNESDEAAVVLEWHLAHAAMENWIKEHKSGFSLEKLPTARFHANWAYLLIGQLAYNLVIWFKRLVLPAAYRQSTVKTIRHHLWNLAGKIVRSGRRCFLILNEQYRYQEVWRFAIQRLANLMPA